MFLGHHQGVLLYSACRCFSDGFRFAAWVAWHLRKSAEEEIISPESREELHKQSLAQQLGLFSFESPAFPLSR